MLFLATSIKESTPVCGVVSGLRVCVWSTCRSATHRRPVTRDMRYQRAVNLCAPVTRPPAPGAREEQSSGPSSELDGHVPSPAAQAALLGPRRRLARKGRPQRCAAQTATGCRESREPEVGRNGALGRPRRRVAVTGAPAPSLESVENRFSRVIKTS